MSYTKVLLNIKATFSKLKVAHPPYNHAKQAPPRPLCKVLRRTITTGQKNADGDYSLKIDVNGTFPERREAKADEKPEGKDELDKTWAEAQAKLKSKLEIEKKFTK